MAIQRGRFTKEEVAAGLKRIKTGVRVPRDRTILVRLTVSEYNEVLAASRDARSLSEWHRDTILREARKAI